MSCARHLYPIRASASRRDPLSAQSKNSFRWKPHTEEGSCVCQKEVGRPSVSKKRTLVELACKSDPDSRDEDQEKATKKTYCDIFLSVTEKSSICRKHWFKSITKQVSKRRNVKRSWSREIETNNCSSSVHSWNKSWNLRRRLKKRGKVKWVKLCCGLLQ